MNGVHFLRPALILALAGLTCLAGGISGARAQNPNAQAEFKVPAPELPAHLKWFNSKPLTMKDLRGKVVLIDFWEYTCVNCIRTFPYLREWHEKYKDKGLVIIGVHTPEFHFAKDEENVVRAAKEFGLTWPIISDSDYLVWNTYGNRFWPAKYLIDKEGNVRYFHFGEGAYGATEARIQALLKEVDPDVKLPRITEPVRATDKPGAVCYPVTPELYLGSVRGGHEGTLANPEGYKRAQVVNYRDPVRQPRQWEDGRVYLNGQWKNTDEALISVRKSEKGEDYVGIKYHALEVNSVLRPEEGKPVRVYVYHDGMSVARQDRGADIRYDSRGRSYLEVNEPRMYHIIKNAKFGQRTLKLVSDGPGMGIYSFTFVSCTVAGVP